MRAGDVAPAGDALRCHGLCSEVMQVMRALWGLCVCGATIPATRGAPARVGLSGQAGAALCPHASVTLPLGAAG